MQTEQKLLVKFNPEHWFFKHCNPLEVDRLLTEQATITGYLPTFGTLKWQLKDYDSAGFKCWNMGGRLESTTRFSDEPTQMPFLVNMVDVERVFLPIKREIDDLNPDDVNTDDHFWDTFGKSETESTMRWLIKECQKQGHFRSGIQAKGIGENLCLDGLITDLGGGGFLPTRKAIRALAGAGFWKPL